MIGPSPTCRHGADTLAQIVMEYCGAGSVADIMRLRRQTVCSRRNLHAKYVLNLHAIYTPQLREEQIAPIVKGTLKGLEYLHSKLKIHRSRDASVNNR